MKRTLSRQPKRDPKTSKRQLTRRVKSKPSTPHVRYQNMGGYMINPPDDCPYIKMDKEGLLLWVDLALCTGNYCKSSYCERYVAFSAMSDHERKTELREYGVYI